MIYLEPSDLQDAFIADEKEALQLWRPYNQHERLAANKIRPDKPSNYPSVNDGTLSAYLTELPMRILAQLQTGKAKAIDSDKLWLSELVTVIWSNMIVPHATTQAPFLNKQQTALYRAGIYGSCPLFAFFSVRDGYTGADFMVPYIKDVVWEKRKHSDLDCDRAWLTTYYSDTQIKNMIARARKDKTGENTWNPTILQKVLDAGPEERSDVTKNKNERDTSIATGGYRLLTCFQRGTDAPFYTVAPNVDYKIVRTTKNVNPTGDIPLLNLYCYEDLDNPLGKGLVELAGPTQNVLDFITQAHMFATQIGLEPPIEIAGDVTNLVESSLVYSRSKKWRVGKAVVNIKETAGKIYQQMPQIYGLYKTQLMNILGYNDATVSAEAGNPTYSKTPAGIQQGLDRASAHDNFYRKRCDEAFGRLARIMINLHMANMEGQDVVKLFENDIQKLRVAGLDIPEDDSQLEIEWNDLRAKFDFYVDENSSKGQIDAEESQKLQELITTATSSPVVSWYLGQDGSQMHVGEAYKQLFARLGIQNIDRIITPIPVAQRRQAQQQPFPVIDKPKVTIAFDDLPPSAQMGALQDAGIATTPDTPAELQVMKQTKLAKDTPQPPAEDLSQHPVVKLMEQLQIKWTDLPEDVQQQLIPVLFNGIQSQMPSPGAVTQNQKQQDLNLKAAAQEQNAHTNASKTALDLIKTAHDHTLAIHEATKPPEPVRKVANAAANR